MTKCHCFSLAFSQLLCYYNNHDDLLRYFQVFVSGLIGDYERYLQQHEQGDYADMGYRQVPLYLSDEEFDHFTQAFAAAMRPWREYQPGPGRRRRLFTTIVIPEVDMPEGSSDQD